MESQVPKEFGRIKGQGTGDVRSDSVDGTTGIRRTAGSEDFLSEEKDKVWEKSVLVSGGEKSGFHGKLQALRLEEKYCE